MQKLTDQIRISTYTLPAKYKAALAAGSSLLIASPALATGDPGFFIPTSAVTQFSITSFGEFIGAVLSLLFLIAGVLVFVYLIWGGIQWLTSGGDSSATEGARNRITAALVGLAIIALAYAIVQIVQYFFGVTIVSNNADIPQPFTKP